MSGPRLEIVVGELVVRGLSPAEARLAAHALEARLELLAGQGAAPVRERAESFRRLPAVDAPAGRPEAVGEAVATEVWGELGGGVRR